MDTERHEVHWSGLLLCLLVGCASASAPEVVASDGEVDSERSSDADLYDGSVRDAEVGDALDPTVDPDLDKDPEPDPEPQPCMFGGANLEEGQSALFYNAEEAISPDTCASHAQERTCQGGILSGSAEYLYASCDEFEALPQKPNIVFIMLDDLDLMDVGAYGSPDVKTPNIDDVAAKGIRFTQYHANSAVCSPSRAAILTGHYPARFGYLHVDGPASNRGIPSSVTTSADVLREQGYRTMHVGKWHLGEARNAYLPWNKGFDRSVYRTIVPGSGTQGYTRFRLRVDQKTPQLYNDTGEYLTNVLTDHAVQYIETRAEYKQPFFLNLWYLAPHEPLTPPANFNNSPGYDLTTQRGRFAAMVTHADRQLGRVLDALQRTGQASNTVVIITSDNAGTAKSHSGIPGRALTGYKGSLREGGTRVPMVVRWPDGIPVAYRGTTNDSFITGADFMHTFAQLSGGKMPGGTLRPGKSFVRALVRNEVRQPSRDLFWEINNHANGAYEPAPSGHVWSAFAMRRADGLKLVNIGGTLRLFDLTTDPDEQNNIAATNSATVSAMQKEFSVQRRRYADIGKEVIDSDKGREYCTGYRFGGNNAAQLKNTTLYDRHDGELSVALRFKADSVSGEQVLVAREGSWQFSIQNGELVLRIHGERAERVIRGGTIRRNTSTHVAFAAVGFHDSGQSVRMYVDGVAVANDNSPSLNWIRSNNATITLGNDASGGKGFSGVMSKPLVMSVALHPRDVRDAAATTTLPSCP